MLYPYDPNATSSLYHQYYKEQEGRGLKVFKGDSVQDGYGFFGDIWKKTRPLATSIGKKLLTSGLGLASDIIGGKSFKESATKRGKNVAGDALSVMRDALAGKVVKKTNKRSRGGGGPAKKKRKGKNIDVFT